MSKSLLLSLWRQQGSADLQLQLGASLDNTGGPSSYSILWDGKYLLPCRKQGPLLRSQAPGVQAQQASCFPALKIAKAPEEAGSLQGQGTIPCGMTDKCLACLTGVSVCVQHSSIAHQPLLLRHEGVHCKLQLTNCNVQAESLPDAILEVAGTGGCEHRVQALGQRL